MSGRPTGAAARWLGVPASADGGWSGSVLGPAELRPSAARKKVAPPVDPARVWRGSASLVQFPAERSRAVRGCLFLEADVKAIQLTAPKQFRLLDVEPPGPPGPGEALVRVHRVGVCGSDVSGYLGKMPFFSYPRIPGHELGVEVLEVGEGVTNVRPGDRCSVEPYMNCGRCFACREGAGNCCQKLQVLGVHTDGGLRERMLVRADKLHPSDRLSFDQLALVETLAIGCHCAERAAPKPGDVVLVIGAGPIGLSVIEFLRLKQACVFVADISEQRLR